MHRQIMHAPKNIIIDHINRNGLDNRKANLRFATPTQNAWNSISGLNRGTSKYKGVWWDRKSKKWRTVLSLDGKNEHLGFFDDENIKLDASVRRGEGEKIDGLVNAVNEYINLYEQRQ